MRTCHSLLLTITLFFLAPAAWAQNLFLEGDALSTRTYNTDNGPTNSQLTLDFPITQAGVLQNIVTWGETSGQNGSGIGQSFEVFVLRPVSASSGSTNYNVVFGTGYMTVGSVGTNTFMVSGTPFGLQVGDVIAHYGRGIPFDNGTGGPSSVYIAVNLPPPVLNNTITLPSSTYPLYNDGGRNYAIQVQALGQPFLVTTNSDSGPGSLRQAVLDANALGGTSTINFATNLSGATITLTSGELTLNTNMTIDASALPGGITINGHHTDRIFVVISYTTNLLTALTLTNGYVNGYGGAIYNDGDLTVNRCTLAGNTAAGAGDLGGGIYNNTGVLTVNQCSVVGNSAGDSGGGILNWQGVLHVNQSTIYGNSSGGSIFGSGGGIGNYSGTATLTNSIVAGNTTTLYTNLAGAFTSASSFTDGNPQLLPLANNGGPTPTVLPMNGSPVIDAGSDSAAGGFTTDQRGAGFPRVAGLHVDLGAVESSYAPAGPAVVTQPATGLNLTVATLNATVIRNGVVTTNYFQFGTTPSYGFSTVPTVLNAGPSTASANLTGLAPATTYHFRAVATNNLGSAYGSDMTFRTGGLISSVTNATDTGSGTLRDAITASSVNGDSIVLATNLSGATITLTGGELLLNNNLTLDASGLPGGLSINGHGAARVFEIASGVTNVFNNLTITNGNDTTGNGGGGIWNEGVLTLNQCIVAGNSATNNPANSGGGGIQNYGLLYLYQSTVAGNMAVLGGGIRNDGLVTASQSTLSGNSAIGSNGGGIENYGTLIGAECTVAGNTAAGNGGGIRDIGAANSCLTNCTISANVAATNGGGGISTATLGTLTLSACIVAGDAPAAGDLNGAIVDAGNNLTNGAPLLAPLGNFGGPTQTMPPLPGSPAIDAGNDTVTASFATDQRGAGFPRLAGQHVDIGAVESGDPIPGFTPVVTVSSDAINSIGTGAVSLREAIAFATNNSAITFASNLSGATIVLTNADGQLLLNQNLTIDASALPGGITVNGNASSRVFFVNSGATNTFNSLTIANGLAQNGLFLSSPPGGGGGIFCEGTLVLLNSSVVSNSVGTISEPYCFAGGIACEYGDIRLTNCTVAFNQVPSTNNPDVADGQGGAFYNDGGRMVFDHCTIAGNQATAVSGGVDGGGLSEALLHGTVLANGNTDFYEAGTVTSLGNNFISDGTSSPFMNGVNGDQVGTAGSPLNALLSPLGNYGGPTPTMPPLPGSTLIDTGGSTTLAKDQRGYPRVVGPAVDIGSVELEVSQVITTADTIPGSLRYAITYASNNATITFGANLSGSTILVTNGQIVFGKNLTLDGSTLPAGVAISGNHTNRIFAFNSGTTNLLRDLTLTNGYVVGTGNSGGAINNSGTLTVVGCTLVSNTAPDAGALINNSLCTVRNCTLTGNTASVGNGGAIDNENGALLYVMHSTCFGNYASAGAGGIDNYLSQLYITNSIIAGNTSVTAGNDIYNFGSSTVTAAGSNIVQTLVNAGTENGAATLIAANPLLAPLGNYGGPTPTMPPLPGSPAIDRATATMLIDDQRNFPRPVGSAPDIGAVEGVYNAAGPGTIKSITPLGNGSVQISFTNLDDGVFPVLAATNLSQSPINWIQIGFATNSPIGSGQFPFTDTQATHYPQRFYRVSSP